MNLADFSSRGVEAKGGTVVIDGETFTWADRPTVTAPGVDIVSTRVVTPLSALSLEQDASGISPALIIPCQSIRSSDRH